MNQKSLPSSKGSNKERKRFLPGFVSHKWHVLIDIQIATEESLIENDFAANDGEQIKFISEMRRAIGDYDPATASDHGLKIAISLSPGGEERSDGSMVAEFVIPTSHSNLEELWICFLTKGWQPRIARRQARVVPDKDNPKFTWWSYKLSAILSTGDDDHSFKLRDDKSGSIWSIELSITQQKGSRTASTLMLTATKTKG